jgi:hypothetical protein
MNLVDHDEATQRPKRKHRIGQSSPIAEILEIEKGRLTLPRTRDRSGQRGLSNLARADQSDDGKLS